MSVTNDTVLNEKKRKDQILNRITGAHYHSWNIL